MAVTPVTKRAPKDRALRLALWILALAMVAAIYSFLTQPDEPLDRLRGIQVVDDHKVVEGKTCVHMLKVRADKETARQAVVNALPTNMPWYPTTYKPRPMGKYCTITSADGRYDITITPGSTGVYTQISENRPAGMGERVEGWFQGFVVDFGVKKA